MLKMFLKASSFAALVSMTPYASAYFVSGQVVCTGDGSPLSGIVVSASQGSSTASETTGADGSYEIVGGAADLGEGEWIMSVDTPYDVAGPASVSVDPVNFSVTGVNYQVDDPSCRGPVCGDGILDPGEECDDGNLIDGDGCSALCELEPFCGDGILDPGEACDDGNNADGDGCSATCMFEPFCGDGNLDPGEQCDDGNNVDGDGCSASCEVEGGGEGCTPGYWRQEHHFDSYPAPYDENTVFDDAFGSAVFGSLTLSEATRLTGGGLNALGRHAAAALLNAASGDVSYDLTVIQVIMTFNDAVASGDYEAAKDTFADFNEQGCPLD